jgi:hypothetical protein
MKRLTLSAIVALGLLSFSAASRAEEVTLSGVGACAKCILSLTSKCQNAITVTGKDGKKEVILMEHNGKARDFHDTICQHEVKIIATGTLTEQDGKKVLIPTKIVEGN